MMDDRAIRCPLTKFSLADWCLPITGHIDLIMVLFFLFFVFLFGKHLVGTGREISGHALLEFGMHLHDPCGSLENWQHSDPTPCEWAGVTCSSDQLHILSINLAGKQLGGNITLDVTGLPWLQALNLSSNLFEGHIPASFGNFSSLRILKLQSNNLSGAIPPELGLLLTLTDLDLSNNKLQGEIPESLNSLTKLSFL
jgi:hypothetical protein